MLCLRGVIVALAIASSDAYSPAAGRLGLARSAAQVRLPATTCRAGQQHMPLPLRVPAVGRSNGAAMVVKETSVRSAVKAIGWRLTAGIVTACTSFIYTKSLATAATIVGWDLCSKSVTMFIGERLWNNVDWGKDKGADSSQRSLAKALAWRLFAAVNTLIGATLLTKGKAGVAGKIAGTDSVVKTVLFYFYERIWATISWGKEEIADADDVTVTVEATSE